MDKVYRAMDVLSELGVQDGTDYDGIEYNDLLDVVIILLDTMVARDITLDIIVDIIGYKGKTIE